MRTYVFVDDLANGWVADTVKYEPVEKLRVQLKSSLFVTLVFLVLFIAAILTGLGSLAQYGFFRMDFLLALLTVLMVLSAVKMRRFIMLRIIIGLRN